MKNTRYPRPSRASGFTLLELMTAVTVMAVLLGLGVPAFTNIMRNNQIAAESGNLVSALQLARSEALKRGIRISVCAAAVGETCAGTDDWSKGWIMFADDFGSAGVLDPSDEVLQVWPAPANNVLIRTEATSVTFTRTARAEFPETLEVFKAGCGPGQMREISINLSGRVALNRVDCPEE